MNVRFAACVFLAALATAGCSTVSSTTRRSGLVGLGASAASAGAYALADRDPGYAIGGAAVGAAATHLALGEDPAVRQEGFDEGYVHGQSDAIKRQYFLRQALEVRPLAPPKAGQPVYYVVPGPEVTSDGRQLAPHQVSIRVTE